MQLYIQINCLLISPVCGKNLLSRDGRIADYIVRHLSVARPFSSFLMFFLLIFSRCFRLKSPLVQHVLVVIVDGISIDTFKNVNPGNKQVYKYYNRMVASGELQPRQSDANINRNGIKRKQNEEHLDYLKKKLKTKQKPTFDDLSGKHSLQQRDELAEETSDCTKDAVDTTATSGMSIAEIMFTWLPQTIQYADAGVEIVNPKKYSHSVVHDITRLQVIPNLAEIIKGMVLVSNV